jgi:hypothetical protein
MSVKRYIVNGTFIDDYSHTQAKVPMVMASDYEALERERDALLERERYYKAASVFNLMEENKALKADAERYRWLKAQLDDRFEEEIFVRIGGWNDYADSACLDSDIDAERRL